MKTVHVHLYIDTHVSACLGTVRGISSLDLMHVIYYGVGNKLIIGTHLVTLSKFSICRCTNVYCFVQQYQVIEIKIQL